MGRYRSSIRFQVTLELSPEDRETLARDGVFDPTDKRQLRNLARYAVRQVIADSAENQGEADARDGLYRASDDWDG